MRYDDVLQECQRFAPPEPSFWGFIGFLLQALFGLCLILVGLSFIFAFLWVVGFFAYVVLLSFVHNIPPKEALQLAKDNLK